MSEHSPALRLDLGLAELTKEFANILGVERGTMLPRVIAQAQQARVEQAQANLKILRKIGVYLQNLHFGESGLKDRVRRFARSASGKNALRLQDALNHTRNVVEVETRELAALLSDPTTDKYINNDFPELIQLINYARNLKRNLYDDESDLRPQTLLERLLPFLRSKRYLRIAQSYKSLEGRFDEVTLTVDNAQKGIQAAIDKYEDVLATELGSGQGSGTGPHVAQGLLR